MELSVVIPTSNEVTLCGLEADVQGKRLVAEACEKEEAADMYEDALAAGGSAMLMEKTDPFTSKLSIGRLDAGEVVGVFCNRGLSHVELCRFSLSFFFLSPLTDIFGMLPLFPW